MAPDRPIYLDHAATTPCDPSVLDAMLPHFSGSFGNPSSRRHRHGLEAAEAVESARSRVAALIGADAREVLFTSGSTESNNLAIRGVSLAAGRAGPRRGHIVTGATEHKSVLGPCHRLAGEGFDITILPPGPGGAVPADAVAGALRDDTVLVSIMWANNETGAVGDIRRIGELCRGRGIPFHTDATQAAGTMPIDVDADHIDLLSLSAHKVYGPKGAGALYVRRRARRIALAPLADGGGQERGLRPGTLNVPGIVGLGAACELALARRAADADRLAALRDRLERSLLARLGIATVNGATEPGRRLPHITNLRFAGIDGERLMRALSADIACSGGSACTSAAIEPSHVLTAMGLTDAEALASIRLSLGRGTTDEQVDLAIDRIAAAVTRLRDPIRAVGAGNQPPAG